MTGSESQAKQVAQKARNKAAAVTGDSRASHRLRDKYDGIADGLEAAVRLCNGPVPERSTHWRLKLPGLITDALERLEG